MPREKRKRGRREEIRQRKRQQREEVGRSTAEREDDVADDGQDPDFVVEGDAGDDFIQFDHPQPPPSSDADLESQFHGLLDPDEQEYYANVNTKLVSNDFDSSDDRAVFIDAVHRETQGKELKVASSQSCSRYLERILTVSTPDQLQRMLASFLGHLNYLVRHRFGSHCCETLLVQAAQCVNASAADTATRERDEMGPTMEQLFLQAVDELAPNMGFLLTDRFASHTVRVLFLILSGEPLDDESVKAMLASKKKEHVDALPRPDFDTQPAHAQQAHAQPTRRSVPPSFRAALTQLIDAAVASLDTSFLRTLATHPTGNPVLQLLLQLELLPAGKNKPTSDSSVLNKLLPDADWGDETDSAKFIADLVYHSTGSHLVEILVQKLPGKVFKKLYKNVLRPRLHTMAKNDTASYVAIRILMRLGKDDLAEAKTAILPGLTFLLARRRTGLIKVLVERCTVRHVNLDDIAALMVSELGPIPTDILLKLLNYDVSADADHDDDVDGRERVMDTQVTDVHGSLLAQAMLQAPQLGSLVQEGLLALDVRTLVNMSRSPASSRVIQTALAPTESNAQFRRQFVPHFYPHVGSLADDMTGSYVIDALWSATDGLHFMKERVAQQLARSEGQIRESPFGRKVWKNWAMDTYQRRPNEWRAMARAATLAVVDATHTPQPNRPEPAHPGRPTEAKTAIQLARERYAKSTHGTQRHDARENYTLGAKSTHPSKAAPVT